MNFIITQNGVSPSAEGKMLQAPNQRRVYEVIRLIDEIALFLEDHFDRLKSSVQMSGIHFEMGLPEFKQKISALIEVNGQPSGNVKFILSEVEKTIQWSFSFIPHSYPTPDDYKNGVPTGLLMAERENPSAKVIQNTITEQANELIAEKKLHEVLLVDRNGMITEGSRSNVFFVKSEKFYTAPANKVLAGVTRKKVMECLVELDFQIIQETVPASEAGEFEAVFLTGTSPKVLPVNCIDNFKFTVNNPCVAKLMARYDSMIEAYLKSHRAK